MHIINAPQIDSLYVDLPASKSVTHRILILAALNQGQTFIIDPLMAEDTEITMQALKNMGAEISISENTIEVTKSLGLVKDAEIYLGNSGSSARFLIPLAAYLDKPFRFDGSDRLHQRPFAELFKALRYFDITVESKNDTLPATIYPSKVAGGKIQLHDLPSSQIITALMMSALWMNKDLEIHMPKDTPSLPYIRMTYKLMKRLGLSVAYESNIIRVNANRPGFDWNFRVEKDFSAASYWVVLSMLHNLKLTLPNVTLPSFQGDERIFEIAQDLGSEIMIYPDRMELQGKISKGMEINCNEIPDLVPALSVLALFAPETSRLTNIKHLEYKESNRVSAIQTNISALGGKTDYQKGNLEIIPQKTYSPAKLDSFDDHRIAMSFAVAGTRIPGTAILKPDCVKKSYPEFWNDFEFWQEAAHA
jgi:3-phosphoshikimate 1-carboxyvinyltransferase